ncbi:MAG: hypothetical protein ABEK84_03640 [Salinibacter sp.]
MTKRLFSVFVAVLLMAGVAGCGLVGWHGDPKVKPYLKVHGTMKQRQVPNRSAVWTIEADTATYVPRQSLPAHLQKDGLKVSATGIVEEPPDFLSGSGPSSPWRTNAGFFGGIGERVR